MRLDTGAIASSGRPVQVNVFLNGATLSPEDRKVFAIMAYGLRDPEGFYHFTPTAAGSVLMALSGRYVRMGARPIEFVASEARLFAEAGVQDTTRSLTLRLKTDEELLAIEAVRFLSEMPVYALHGSSIYRVETLASLDHLKRWQAHSVLSLPREDEGRITEAMNALCAFGVAFDSSDEGQGEPPRFSLALDGDAETIRARLAVRYGPVELPLFKTGSQTHVTSDGRLVRRDVDAEKGAIEALKRAGFSRDGQGFSARGDKAIEVWVHGIPKLPANWSFYGPRPAEVVRLRTLSPRLAVTLSRNSWFDLDISFADSDQSVDLAQVRSLIAAGRRYVRLSDGSTGELPRTLTEQIRRILGETGAEPEGAKMTLAPYEAADVQKLIDAVPDANVDIRPRELLRTLAGLGPVEAEGLPSGLKADLRGYQKSGFDWLVFLHRCGMAGVLADDMGLGKTVQTLALLQWAKENGAKLPALVVAPTSVIINWQREAARFTPGLKTLILAGTDREKLLGTMSGFDLVLVSYAILRRDAEQLRRHRFSYIVLDEAQHVKNPASLGARVVSSLQAEHRLALTGTPIENRLSDIWSIFHLLMPGFLGSETSFRNRYARPIEADGNVDVRTRLRNRIRPFILRRLKEEVARDLPPRTDTIIPVDLSPGQQALYKDMLKVARERVESVVSMVGLEKAHISILSELLRLRQICNDPRLLKMPPGTMLPPSAKLEAFAELVHNLIDEGHRALVFSQFTEMLAILVEWADAEGIPYEYLDGSTRNRQEHIDRFNSVDGPPLFFISLKAGGTGLNLTYADYVIHYDPWWNPAVEEQAINRAHRIGQDKPVFSYRLITQGTVEQKIVAMQARKQRLAEGVISSDEEIGKRLTAKDLAELFSEAF
jgi:Superfamily II DNA/RNA helicases, SNF2 family